MSNPRALLIVIGLVWVIGQGCGTPPANSSLGTQPTNAVATTTPAATTAATRSEVAKEEAKVTYLEGTIPSCTPVVGSNRDPCLAGTPPSVHRSDVVSQRTKEHARAYEDVLNYSDLVASKTTHIVLRGTVLPDTTRCGIYDLIWPDYNSEQDRQQFAGWIKEYCFADVRVNEYLLGVGPPMLSVIVWIDNPPHPDYPRPSPPLDEQLADTYEGVEGILFLSTGRSLAMEAWEMVFFWDVQQVDGAIRVIDPDKDEYPQTTENLALLDNTLADFRTKITKAAATRAANTGGRVGTDPNLPLLITDANDLPTYYGAIGAVYDDPAQAPAKPPPVPGDNTQPPDPEP